MTKAMSEIPEAALLQAAKNLLAAPVRGAPKSARFVEPGGDVALIGDEGSRRIGEALKQAAQQIEANATLIVLERADDKQLKVLPPVVRTALARAQAAVFAASAPNAERSMREQLAAVVKACNL